MNKILWPPTCDTVIKRPHEKTTIKLTDVSIEVPTEFLNHPEHGFDRYQREKVIALLCSGICDAFENTYNGKISVKITVTEGEKTMSSALV